MQGLYYVRLVSEKKMENYKKKFLKTKEKKDRKKAYEMDWL